MTTGITLKDFLTQLRAQGGYQTLEHVIGVANLMEETGRALGMDEAECKRLYYCGLLHDAGKLFIPERILNSDHALSDYEYAVIKTHVISGEGIIKQMKIHEDLKQGAINCAKYHHAWYNGMKKTATHKGGYFKGMRNSNISGEAIPLEARICAVCDVLNAMMQERSYSPAMSAKEALKIADKMLMDGQFDSKIYRVVVEDVLHEEFLASLKETVAVK